MQTKEKATRLHLAYQESDLSYTFTFPLLPILDDNDLLYTKPSIGVRVALIHIFAMFINLLLNVFMSKLYALLLSFIFLIAGLYLLLTVTVGVISPKERFRIIGTYFLLAIISIFISSTM